MAGTLRALEAATVAKMGPQLQALKGSISAKLAKAVRDNPDKSFAALWKDDPSLQESLQRSADITQQRIERTLKAGRLAAIKLAAADLERKYGITYKESESSIDDLLKDVAAYMKATVEAIKMEIAKAYKQPLTDRRRAVTDGISTVVRGLSVRVNSSASVVITRTYNETLQAGWQSTTDTEIQVVWKTTSGNPCKRCLALEGKTLNLNQDFYRDSDYNTKTPPRHIGCACILVAKLD